MAKRVEPGRPDAAGKVGAGLERHGRGALDVGGFLVPVVNVDDGAAVGDDEALEAPSLAQVLLKKHLVGAGGELIDGVVGAHHRLHLAVGDGGAKGGQVGLFEIARRGIDIDGVARRLRAGVYGEVLAGGHGAEVIQVRALHAPDEGAAHAAGQERILAVGLLAAAPAWVAEDVDVRRPEGKPEEDAVIAFALCLVVFGARFLADGVAHHVDRRRIPSGGHADSLGKDGDVAGPCHTVQSLVPGLVVGNLRAAGSQWRSLRAARLSHRASCGSQDRGRVPAAKGSDSGKQALVRILKKMRLEERKMLKPLAKRHQISPPCQRHLVSHVT